ncbi:DMT family transporter [Sulfuriferula sp. GW1]|uniref:DMT family transporter n=1 Tax=Sulfuriferula sp. GW1 TaxID=3345111 RepID=UPI0039B04BED
MANSIKHVAIQHHAITGGLLALLAAIGFSAKAILVKLAYAAHVDAITLLAVRMAFSVPVFLAVAVWTNTRKQQTALTVRDWFVVVALGLIGYYLASYLDFLGLQYISAGLERLILFLYPTMVVVLSAWLYRQSIKPRERFALLLSYAGIALVFVHDAGMRGNGISTGALLVFGSALAYAIYLIGANHTIARIGATRFTAYAMTVASGASIAQFAVTHPLNDLILSERVYYLGLAMAVFSTVLPAFLISAAMRRIGAGKTALIGAIGPVSTIYLAWVFLGERVSLTQIAGSALVLAGVLAISIQRSGR